MRRYAPPAPENCLWGSVCGSPNGIVPSYSSCCLRVVWGALDLLICACSPTRLSSSSDGPVRFLLTFPPRSRSGGVRRAITGWRWGTFSSVVRRLDRSIELLAQRFCSSKWNKDHWGVAGMAHATSNYAWQRQLRLLRKFADFVESLRGWGISSCSCHGSIGDPTYDPTCPQKGRNLPFIGEQLDKVDRGIKDYLTNELPRSCADDLVLYNTMSKCYAVFQWKLRYKTTFTDELPWLVVFGDHPSTGPPPAKSPRPPPR